jgi:hypothetical protein
MTMRDAQSYCEGIHTEKYGPWRLPTIDELYTAFMWPGDQAQGHFIDVPDGRLWGQLAVPPQRNLNTGNGDAMFLTVSVENNYNSGKYDLRETLPFHPGAYYTVKLTGYGFVARDSELFNGNAGSGQSPWDESIWIPSNSVRAVCVADLK